MSTARSARDSAAVPAGSKGESGREPRDARRRRQLIEATIDCIAENGLSGTTVARVAEIAELSAGVVNFYFRTKDALLLATLNYVDGEFSRRQDEARRRAGDDPLRQLDAMIENSFDPEVTDRRRVAVWTAFWGEAQARDDYLRVCGDREESTERDIVELFDRIVEAGGYTHLDPAALGSAFHHLLSSLPEFMLGNDEPFDYEAAKATCRSFLKSIFPQESAALERSEPAGAKAAARAPASSAEHEFETLPTWVYHDPEFFELEKQAVFRRHWLFVGHVCEVAEAGDYMTLDAVDERAVVIRGEDGTLRAFHNVCRHRASRVVRGERGHCPGAIVCPYHGWSYGLDGALEGVTSRRSFGDLGDAERGLVEIDVEVWMGFVFVRFEGDGPALAESMQPFEAEAAHYRIEAMQPLGPRFDAVYDFNWKLFAENDAEGYHIAVGHPGLQRLFGNSYEESAPTRDGSRARSVLRKEESPVWSEGLYQRLLPEVAHLPPELQRAWVYYGVFPSTVVQATPDSVDCYQVLPVDVGRTRMRAQRYALPDDRRAMRAARYLNERIIRVVSREDLDYCRWTDEGVRSSSYRGTRLSSRESGVRYFQERMRACVPVCRRSERPAAGRLAALNDTMRIAEGRDLP